MARRAARLAANRAPSRGLRYRPARSRSAALRDWSEQVAWLSRSTTHAWTSPRESRAGCRPGRTLTADAGELIALRRPAGPGPPTSSLTRPCAVRSDRVGSDRVGSDQVGCPDVNLGTWTSN